MNTKTHFPFRIDVWDERGDSDHPARSRCGRLRDGSGHLLGRMPSMAEGEDHSSQGACIVEKSWTA